MATLAKVCGRLNWLRHGYRLMGNHYDLLVETPEASLSKGMGQLNGVFTQYVNRRYGRVGHLFQGPFKGILIQKEAYLRELARYILLNLVRAGMVEEPEEWRWSSHRRAVGSTKKAEFLCSDWLLSGFGVPDTAVPPAQ